MAQSRIELEKAYRLYTAFNRVCIFLDLPAVIACAIVAESKSVICQMYILQKRFGISIHSSNVESVLLQLYLLTCVCLKFL